MAANLIDCGKEHALDVGLAVNAASDFGDAGKVIYRILIMERRGRTWRSAWFCSHSWATRRDTGCCLGWRRRAVPGNKSGNHIKLAQLFVLFFFLRKQFPDPLQPLQRFGAHSILQVDLCLENEVFKHSWF